MSGRYPARCSGVQLQKDLRFTGPSSLKHLLQGPTGPAHYGRSRRRLRTFQTVPSVKWVIMMRLCSRWLLRALVKDSCPRGKLGTVIFRPLSVKKTGPVIFRPLCERQTGTCNLYTSVQEINWALYSVRKENWALCSVRERNWAL